MDANVGVAYGGRCRGALTSRSWLQFVPGCGAALEVNSLAVLHKLLPDRKALFRILSCGQMLS